MNGDSVSNHIFLRGNLWNIPTQKISNTIVSSNGNSVSIRNKRSCNQPDYEKIRSIQNNVIPIYKSSEHLLVNPSKLIGLDSKSILKNINEKLMKK
jgi:hypothetical protein